jgi:hypothetical protein
VVEPEARLPLSELIDAVRRELLDAAMAAKGAELQFEVRDVVLEIQVATTGTRNANGGVNLWVVSLGGKAEKSNAATHTVTLTMSAVTSQGTKFNVSELSSRDIRRQ